MMKRPLRPGTRPVGAAQLAVKDTSTDGPGFAATPKGDGPRPQDFTYLLTLNEPPQDAGAVHPPGSRVWQKRRLAAMLWASWSSQLPRLSTWAWDMAWDTPRAHSW